MLPFRSRKNRPLVFVVILGLLTIAWATCAVGCAGSRPYERSAYVLDTALTVRIVDARADTPRDVDDLVRYLRAVERVVNYYDRESELSRLNRRIAEARGAVVVSCSSTLSAVIQEALVVARLTGGFFDPTVGPLTDAWRFDAGGRVPAPEEVKQARAQVSFRAVRVIGREAVAVDNPRVKLDLGGVAKGWAIDLAAAFLRHRGYRHFLVNGVSSTRAFGTRTGSERGEPFRVGIEHPRGGGIVAVVAVGSGESASTSGDYQRYFVAGGRRYHHILDPRTGYPARGFRSVTVVAPLPAARVDALSTAVFAMGPERGLAFVRRLAGKLSVKVVAVDAKGRVVVYPQGDWVRIAEPPAGAR